VGDGCCFACGCSSKATQPLAALASIPLLKERYALLEYIGEGGFSTVHKGRDTQTDQVVAIKAISLKGLSGLEKIEATDAFNREVQLLSQLTLPQVPRLYDHFSDAECWYLVMEFIDGITLEDYLKKRSDTDLMPLIEVLDLGLLLCDVFARLHSSQPTIIYRDLKPANIMLTREGRLFLIDFGIARRVTLGKRKDTMPFGSPGYAPPEQYGRGQTTERSDIYSLGALLHQLLSGQDPARTPFTFPPLPQQDRQEMAELDRLIQQMVSLQSQERPESMQVVKREIEQIALQQRQLRVLQQQGQPSGRVRSSLSVQQPYAPTYPPSTSGWTAPRAQSQAQIFPTSPWYRPYPLRRNFYALAGLVCSLFSFVSPFIILGGLVPLLALNTMLFLLLCLFMPVLSIILSSIGLHHAKVKLNLNAKSARIAGWGLILGVVALVLVLLLCSFVLMLMSSPDGF